MKSKNDEVFSHEEKSAKSYKKDAVIGFIIGALIIFTGVSVFTSELAEIILSLPVFLFTILTAAVVGGVFIGAISRVRQRSLAMDVTFMEILFNVGALKQQLVPVADGTEQNDELNSDEVAKEIKDLADKIEDIISEARDLLELLPWWLEAIKSAVLLADIAAVIAAILALTPPVTVLGILALIGAIAALIATIGWIINQLVGEAYERGKLDQKQADLKKMEEELLEKVKKLGK